MRSKPDLFRTPKLVPELRERLEELDRLREALSSRVGRGGQWLGALRRLARASSVGSSTSIEGFSVPEEEVAALVSGEATPLADEEDRMAVACYARAMDHVGVMADDPGFRWDERVILDLHFDACWFQRDMTPGRWRTGPIGVTGGGSLIYQAPPAEQVAGLMADVVGWLEEGDLQAPVVVRAAMAHLHVVSIHPFRDGNGRIARIVQSLVLAREGLLSPEFASIEDHLARHTAEYYRVLREVQGGHYQPARSAAAWIRFCIDAHLAQARQRLDQIARAAARWGLLEEIVGERGWPDRLVTALEQSLMGGTDRARYAAEAEVSPASATNDLRRLLDAGLLEQRGRGRNTAYVPSDTLRKRVTAAEQSGRR
jgi:Fic family protein